ncbi:hypothetical protein D3C81_1892910 [compost metagenome]
MSSTSLKALDIEVRNPTEANNRFLNSPIGAEFKLIKVNSLIININVVIKATKPAT